MDPKPEIAWVASVTAASDGKGTRAATGTFTGVSGAGVESWALARGTLVRGPGGGPPPHAARRTDATSKLHTRWRVAVVKSVE
jgi:acetaldehyde dehydrogenase (acetylating)